MKRKMNMILKPLSGVKLPTYILEDIAKNIKKCYTEKSVQEMRGLLGAFYWDKTRQHYHYWSLVNKLVDVEFVDAEEHELVLNEVLVDPLS